MNPNAAALVDYVSRTADSAETLSNELDTAVLALESIIRWTDRDDLEPADLIDAIHSVARVALDEAGPR